VILKINYTKTLVQAAQSVRYHAFRSREQAAERLGAFDRHSDRANVSAFIKSLDDPLTKDRTTRSGHTIQPAKMHRLMFAMRRRDFEACGFTSWKPVIREALENFEKQQGIKLDWIAAEHLVENHPHVHVDVKSVYTAADGTRHRLRITNEMRIQLKAAVEAVIERERRQREEERQQARAFNQAVHDVAMTLLRGLREAGREDERESDSLANRAPRRRRPQPDRDSDDRGR
jgi:type IV secretory pathway VirD2 relaxase